MLNEGDNNHDDNLRTIPCGPPGDWANERVTMRKLKDMSDAELRYERDRLDNIAASCGIGEEETQRRQALDRELFARTASKPDVLAMIQLFQTFTEKERELFNDHCDNTIGECDACGKTAPLSPGWTSSGEGDFCSWECES